MHIKKIQEAIHAATVLLHAAEQADIEMKDMEQKRNQLAIEVKALTDSKAIDYAKESAAKEAHRQRMNTINHERGAAEKILADLQREIMTREMDLRAVIGDRNRELAIWDRKINALKADYAELERKHMEFKKAVGL